MEDRRNDPPNPSPEGLQYVMRVPDGEIQYKVPLEPVSWNHTIIQPIAHKWVARSPNSDLVACIFCGPIQPNETAIDRVSLQIRSITASGASLVMQQPESPLIPEKGTPFGVELLFQDIPTNAILNNSAVKYMATAISEIETDQAFYLMQTFEFSDNELTLEMHREMAGLFHRSFTL